MLLIGCTEQSGSASNVKQAESKEICGEMCRGKARIGAKVALTLTVGAASKTKPVGSGLNGQSRPLRARGEVFKNERTLGVWNLI
jgi:hypothetical protein